MAARLGDEQANVRVHAYGVGRGVDKQELLRICAARDPDSAEDRCAAGMQGAGGACAGWAEQRSRSLHLPRVAAGRSLPRVSWLAWCMRSPLGVLASRAACCAPRAAAGTWASWFWMRRPGDALVVQLSRRVVPLVEQAGDPPGRRLSANRSNPHATPIASHS